MSEKTLVIRWFFLTIFLALITASFTVTYGDPDIRRKYDFDDDTSEWLTEEPDLPTGSRYLIIDDHGGWWIDAEKIPGSDGMGNPPPNGVGDEDDLLCWAATASNMIDYAGWGFVGDMDDADEYMDYFEDHTTDYGSYTIYGLEWWFDGNLPTNEGNWSVADVSGGDFWNDSGPYSFDVNAEITWNSTDTLPSLDAWLGAGYICGIGIYPNKGSGGHAITCWGFNYDAADPDYYVGVWVTDSDSHRSEVDAPDALRYYSVVFNTTSNRWEMPNKGSGWHITYVTALHPYPTERPVAITNGPYVINEGGSISFSGADSYDPDGDTLHYHWNINDTWTDWSPNSTTSLTIEDDSDLLYNEIYLEVHDGHLKDTELTTLTVNNLPPEIEELSNLTMVEGDLLDVSLDYTNPGVKDTHTATIDWGDGTAEEGVITEAGGSGSVTGSHTYLDEGLFTLKINITDDDGGTDITTALITVENAPPEIEPIPDETIDEGDNIHISGAFTDAGTGDVHNGTIDWGEGTTENLEIYTPSPGSASFSGGHEYGDNGNYTVTVTINDEDGGSTTATTQVTVYNLPPEILTLNPISVNEGEEFSVSAYAEDPGSDDLTFRWEFEHGPTLTNTDYNNDAVPDPYPSPDGIYTFTGFDFVYHTYGDNYIYNLTLTVTDDDGGWDTISTTINVSNLPPEVENSSLKLPYPDNPGYILPGVHALEFSAEASDEGTDDLTFTWSWGDGAETVNTHRIGSSPEGAHPITAMVNQTHIYSNPGEYTVTLNVTDDDSGAAATLTWNIKVLNSSEALDDLNTYIRELPEEAFRKKENQTKNAINNMFSALHDMLADEDYKGFIQHLTRNLRGKCDGTIDGKPNNDWITDATAQQHICSKIDDLTEYITQTYP